MHVDRSSVHVNRSSVHVNRSSMPHIVFVLVDDLGSADAAFRERELHPHDDAQLLTPTLDRLVKEGVQLTSYCARACTPVPRRTAKQPTLSCVLR